MEQRALITGIGTVNPLGLDAPSTWEAMLAGRSGIDTIAAFDAADRFTPLRHRAFHHLHHLDRAAVLDRFASISFIAALPDTARARVLDEIGRVIDAEPSPAGQDRIGLPYRTNLYWCERRGG